jgi:hypothetical protein
MARRQLLALLPLVVAVACSGDDGAGRGDDGRITEAGPVSVFDLQVGDCLKPDEDAEGELTEVEAVPCEEPHTQEVFALPEYEGENPDVYPGEAAIRAFADAACLDAFERYTGADYLDSDLYFSYLHPSLDSWNEGDDRTIVCVVISPGEETTGSVRASPDASTTTTTAADGE